MATQNSRRLWLVGIAAPLLVLGALVLLLQFFPLDLGIGNLVIRTQRGAEYPMTGLDEMVKVTPGEARTLPNLPLPPDSGVPTPPANLIIIIGDGMGLAQISTSSQLLFGAGGGLALERAPVVGLSRAWALDTFGIDSAAAGTALATGFRTNKRVVGMLPDGRAVRNLFEAARAHGMATGILTISYLVDATPSCFSAHSESRKQYAEIFEQMLDSGTDVLLGGSSHIEDSDDPRMHAAVAGVENTAEHGYTLVRDAAELEAAEGRVLGLFPKRGETDSAHGPPLATSTAKLLELLSRHPGGFTALVESEYTDAAGHDNDIARLVEAAAELDDAVSLVYDFAESRGDTLVLLFADHGTGGPGIVTGKVENGRARIRWVTDGHIAHWLPVFALGPGAEAFSGVYDASQIGPTVAALMGLEDYPAIIPPTS